MVSQRTFTAEEARKVGDQIGITWAEVDLEQFRMGLEVELEHGVRNVVTNVTNDDLVLTGKIALAHLMELPDYYTRLLRMEEEARVMLAR
ncbi:MAG: hypothetical protein E4H41_00975 [Gemmatimonadales bacterium]|jgi:hypothetical protein|nr:MAG: hypothetical protein E4H41_00975 [Gemmatimonadales bacterium]